MREPVAIAGAIRAIILAAVAFGLDWTAEQVGALMLAVEAVLTLVLRQSVTPNATATEKIAETARTGIAQTLKAFVLAALVGATVACSVSIKERVVTGYQGTQVALEALHDAERQVFDSKTIPTLTPNAQDRVLGILDKAFAAQQRAGAALLVWEPGAPVPADVTAWLTAADQLIPEIQAVVPELAGRLAVAQDLIAWAKAIVRITELLNITPPARVKALALQGGR